MNIRKVQLNSGEVLIVYVALRKGLGGKGYNADQYRKVHPVIFEMETQGIEENEKGISIPVDKIFNLMMKEKEYVAIFEIVKSSSGWNSKQAEILLPLIEKMENIPAESDEESPK